MSTLNKANEARTLNALNKWRKDSLTGEIYTLQSRADKGELAYIVYEVENGEVTGYGFIHRRNSANLDYMRTEVYNMPKLAYDALYRLDLPIYVLDHDTRTLEPCLSKSEEEALFSRV